MNLYCIFQHSQSAAAQHTFTLKSPLVPTALLTMPWGGHLFLGAQPMALPLLKCIVLATQPCAGFVYCCRLALPQDCCQGQGLRDAHSLGFAAAGHFPLRLHFNYLVKDSAFTSVLLYSSLSLLAYQEFNTFPKLHHWFIGSVRWFCVFTLLLACLLSWTALLFRLL